MFTPGVGLTQAVKERHRGRVVGVQVRTVLGEEEIDWPLSCARGEAQRSVEGPFERLDSQNSWFCQG